LLLVLACSGSKIAGKYVSEENPNDYLELRRDGSLFLQEKGVTLEGKYRVDGDEITLSMSFLGFSVPTKGRVVGNVIIDKDGEKWVKGAVTPTKTTITIVPDNFSIGSGKSMKLTATLQAGQNPLQGKKISWSATSGSVSPASGTTDSSGKVTTTYYAPTELPKNLPLSTAISASFAGSVLYTPSSANSRSSIKIGTYIQGRLIGATVRSGESVSLPTSLRDEKGNPLPGKRVALVDGQSKGREGIVDPPTGVTDANGQVTFTYTASVVTSETVIQFEASFPGDDKYLQSRGTPYAWLVVRPSLQNASPAPMSPAPAGIAWGARVPVDFRIKVVQIADRLQTDPDHLMAVMAFETGETFSPAILNQAGSGAVGLIQFTVPAAQCLKTTTAALGQMTALQQLDYVERYFKECVGPRKPATLADLYMAVLWPRAIVEPDHYVLWQAPDVRYNQNRGLDRNGDGKVTKGEAAGFVQEKLDKGRGADYFG
jgi:hypothetical protein